MASRFACAQNEWSLLRRAVEREVVPACKRFGASLLPYFPLAGGALTGKYRRGEPAPAGTRLVADNGTRWLTDANFARIEALEKFASEHGHTVGELALAWLASQRVVCSVIAGATRPEQVRQNVAALEWRLSRDDRGPDRHVARCDVTNSAGGSSELRRRRAAQVRGRSVMVAKRAEHRQVTTLDDPVERRLVTRCPLGAAVEPRLELLAGGLPLPPGAVVGGAVVVAAAFTITVAVMLGWTLQWYANVPAWAKTCE